MPCSSRWLAGALLATACSRDHGQVADADLDGTLATDAIVVDAPAIDADLSARCTGKLGVPGDTTVTIDVASGARTYLLHIPPQYDPTRPLPLLVALHGLGNGPEELRDVSHFNIVADQRGFVVAYPAGKTNAWNAGACCGLPVLANTDDVGFIGAVLDQLEAQLCIDPKRVFATGFSNGGFMAHRLACELSDRFAAIAVASGQEALPTCTPTRPVPVVQVHGTADPLVPYNGDALLGFPSTLTTMTGWAMRDGCATTTTTIGVTGNVTCISWDACIGTSNVILCTNQGGVHEWVGGGTLWVNDMPPPGLFDTTNYFADFFAAHPMP